MAYLGRPEKRKGPQGYDPEGMMPAILDRITKGESVRQIARTTGMPDEWTIREWGATDRWYPLYARAREAGWESVGEEILDIADDGSNDWMDREARDGRIERVKDHEAIERSRLRLDTRKWILAKMLPKVYGDRLEITGGLALLSAFVDSTPRPPLNVPSHPPIPHVVPPEDRGDDGEIC